MVISTGTIFSRIGTDDERPKDRAHWSALAMWQWRADWRKAKEIADYAWMDSLDRQYEMIQSL
jgi:hypothetical protein